MENGSKRKGFLLITSCSIMIANLHSSQASLRILWKTTNRNVLTDEQETLSRDDRKLNCHADYISNYGMMRVIPLRCKTTTTWTAT